MSVLLGLKKRFSSTGAILLGILLVSIGLEMFLTPHKILPGGVQGVAILLSHVTEMQMGLLLLFINLPFVLFNRGSHWGTLIASLATLLIVAVLTLYLYPFPPFLTDPLQASILGGVILGLGIGLIVRFGWFVDGVHSTAAYFNKKFKLLLSESIMLINLALLAGGGLLFGWAQAIHSIIAYYLAYKVVGMTLNFRSKKIIALHLSAPHPMKELLSGEFQEQIQFYSRDSALLTDHARQLNFSIPGRHITKLKSVVHTHDPHAQLFISETDNTNPSFKIF